MSRSGAAFDDYAENEIFRRRNVLGAFRDGPFVRGDLEVPLRFGQPPGRVEYALFCWFPEQRAPHETNRRSESKQEFPKKVKRDYRRRVAGAVFFVTLRIVRYG